MKTKWKIHPFCCGFQAAVHSASDWRNCTLCKRCWQQFQANNVRVRFTREKVRNSIQSKGYGGWRHQKFSRWRKLRTNCDETITHDKRWHWSSVFVVHGRDHLLRHNCILRHLLLWCWQSWQLLDHLWNIIPIDLLHTNRSIYKPSVRNSETEKITISYRSDYLKIMPSHMYCHKWIIICKLALQILKILIHFCGEKFDSSLLPVTIFATYPTNQ